MAREAAERTGKQIGILGDLPGPKLRIGDVEDGIVGLRPGWRSCSRPRDCIGSDERLLGLLRRAPRGRDRRRPRLPRRRPHPPAGARGRRRRGPLLGRGRRPRLLPPGAQPARGRGRPARGRTRGPRLGRLRARAGDRPARGLVRAPRGGPRAGRAPRAHRRRRHPGDREDREAPGRRAGRGDRQGRHRGSHDRPRRPRDRAPDRAGARRCSGGCSRSPASTRGRRSPRLRCWPRWSPRRGRPGPRSPTSPTRSTRAPTR